MAVYGPIQTDARVIRSAKSLHELGYEIEVLSWNSADGYKSPYFKSLSFSIKKSPTSLFQFWHKVFCYVKKRKKEIDLVYCHDYFMPFLGKIIKRFLNIEWVYDAHELIINRKGSKMSLREKFFCYLEKSSIHSAALVIAANYERMRIIEHVYKLKNCTYVQNIADVIIPEEFNKVEKQNIIVYQGVLTPGRNVKFYVEMQQYLPDDYKLMLIGDGPARKELEEEAKTLNIDNRVIFTGRVTQKELYEKSLPSRIGIITYPLKGLNNYYCAPNKIFEYATLRIPMIATPQPFLKAMFKKYGLGEIVEWGDKDGYINAVRKICENYDDYTKNMELFLLMKNIT